jgi:DNA-binding response OmpR family regulator
MKRLKEKLNSLTGFSGKDPVLLPTLLIADDEPAIRLLLREFFKEQFNCVVARDGREAIEYLRENDLPWILVLDLEMPEMSGLQVIREIRKDECYDSIIILVLSSKESSKDRVECLKAGADDYLLKPFNPQELEARIQAILRRIPLIHKS